jgi:hypothetical protein
VQHVLLPPITTKVLTLAVVTAIIMVLIRQMIRQILPGTIITTNCWCCVVAEVVAAQNGLG